MNPIVKQHLLSVSRWLMAAGLVIFIICLYSVGNPSEAAEAAPTVTMQSALVEIIQQVQTGVQSGVAFLQQEIPDVVRQLLVWKLSANLAFAGLGLLGILLYIWACVVTFRISKKIQNDLPFIPTIIVGGFIALGFGGMIIAGGFEALQIWLAPKVYLIEYASKLVK